MNRVGREYFHHLHDTLILLGAGERYAALVEAPETICQEDVEDLRRFNGKLIDGLKQKLVDINKIAIEAVPPSPAQRTSNPEDDDGD